MKFIINKKEGSKIPSTKLYVLNPVVTNIDDLLNDSIINISQNTIPVLEIEGSKYLINDFNPNNYKEDYELLITESDLIAFSSGAVGGSFIPLTGTEVASPVSGSIQMNAYGALPNLYVESGNIIGGLSLDSTEASIGLNDSNTGDSSYLGIFSNRIFANNSLPTSRGLTSDYDYTANITSLDFVQKKYIDEQVTLQLVTTSGAVTTSSVNVGGLTLTNSVSGSTATFDTDNLTSDKTITLPDTSGILAIETGIQRTISTAGTVTVVPTSIDFVLVHEAGVTATLTIALPTSPKNNQTVTIMSVGGITDLTITTPSGTIIGTVTTLAALATTKFIWHAPQSKWYKIS